MPRGAIEEKNGDDWAGEAVRPAIPWKQRVLNDPGEDIGTPPCALKPCNRCGLKVKVGLTLLSAGADRGATNNHNYHMISLDGKRAAGERAIRNSGAQVTEPGMAVAASPGRTTPLDNKGGAVTSPVRDEEWRSKTESSPEAAQYIALCRRVGVSRSKIYNASRLQARG